MLKSTHPFRTSPLASRTSGNDEHVDRLKQFASVFCAARVLPDLFCLGPSDRATATTAKNHRAFAEQGGVQVT
jgi:hypothetical protein